MLQRIDAQNQQESTRKMWEMNSQLTIKTPDQLYRHLSGVLIVNIEHIIDLFLVSLLLALIR